jgi:hypothetical protein
VTGRTAPWATDANLALAREMWDNCERVRDIAKAVGTTHAGIVGYAHRWGWPPHPRQPAGAEWRAQRKAAQAAQQAPERRQPSRPAVAAVAAPVAARGPRREACNPAPLAVPTARFHGCQWPIGNPGERGFAFCQATPVVLGGPYCVTHDQIAYYRRSRPEAA